MSFGKDLREIEPGTALSQHNLYAVVYREQPWQIVPETGAPFDAAGSNDAARKVRETFGEHPEWAVVPCVTALERQYRALKLAQ